MKDMTPRFHGNLLNEPLTLKKPTTIFVANTGDLFGEWVQDWQIREVIETTKLCPQHIFQFLTKNPSRYPGFIFPSNCWVGTSITKQEDVPKINYLKKANARIKFISFEPILGFIDEVDLQGIDWAIIGAETELNSYTPKDEKSAKKWAGPLIEKVKASGIPLFLKPNLRWAERIREFPEQKEVKYE
jgi:protein gp37